MSKYKSLENNKGTVLNINNSVIIYKELFEKIKFSFLQKVL